MLGDVRNRRPLLCPRREHAGVPGHCRHPRGVCALPVGLIAGERTQKCIMAWRSCPLSTRRTPSSGSSTLPSSPSASPSWTGVPPGPCGPLPTPVLFMAFIPLAFLFYNIVRRDLRFPAWLPRIHHGGGRREEEARVVMEGVRKGEHEWCTSPPGGGAEADCLPNSSDGPDPGSGHPQVPVHGPPHLGYAAAFGIGNVMFYLASLPMM